ncbi:uncharacterized protein C8Q71DRAFT_717681 [Rhodofomes roseus]|uniref:MYND-type domain-containing protein n=1 Tax=Rhodofomes roseus TaxID=34475 RepID=A0ABQ8K0W4_9APHY|nr:uncharacterized protein C8Q71DRAFT_717681 [Rhodofomes roseus]KAH9829819.1 hypothetical protein C8Q71DRAFT_717681 [Rhodofomes roseus]
MDKIRTTVNIRRLDPDVPFYQDMDKYYGVKVSCLFSYHVEHDAEKGMKDLSYHFTKFQGQALYGRANEGDPDAILDLALRYLSGCGVRKQSSEGALYVLDSFFDPSCDHGYVGHNASRTMLAQAHSCAARAYFLKYLAPDSERSDILADEERFARPETQPLGADASPLAYFLLAAHHANESVKFGLVSPAVLLVGFRVYDIGDALGANVDQTAERGKRFRSLLRAIARRRKEIHSEERKRQRKVDRSPNVYVCAAEGCGIQGEQKSVLRACSGRCPPDLKPSYCSPGCQKKDWPRHKGICKPNSTGKTLKMSEEDKVKAHTLFELGEPEDGGEAQDEEEEEPIEEISTATNEDDEACGPGRIIDIPVPGAPGGSIQVTTSTMDPEFMRSVRDHALNMGR